MSKESPLAALSQLSARSLGVFRGKSATKLGVTRKQLGSLQQSGVIERVFADTYRMTAVPHTSEQRLRCALAWAGPGSAAAGRSAGELYGLEGVRASRPEIVVPDSRGVRSAQVVIHRVTNHAALMLRRHRGLPTTGTEATLLALAAALDDEPFEIACEDARRRRLVSVPSLRAYLDQWGGAGRPGVTALRGHLRVLDPVHASRSTLEVKARRLLVAHGLGNFAREFPLDWNGRTYRFDFAFPGQRTILETNGRRWHDDTADYEYDNEKWSVPGRHGYRIVLATWSKVSEHPTDLVAELKATLERGGGVTLVTSPRVNRDRSSLAVDV
jgi:very-short-patch-repair endonuclease